MPYTDNKSHIIKNAPDKICITLGGAFNNPVYINTNTKLDFILTRVPIVSINGTIYEEFYVYTMDGTIVADSNTNYFMAILHINIDTEYSSNYYYGCSFDGIRRVIQFKKANIDNTWADLFAIWDNDNINLYDIFPLSQTPLSWKNFSTHSYLYDFFNKTAPASYNWNSLSDEYNTFLQYQNKLTASTDILIKIDSFFDEDLLNIPSNGLQNFPDMIEINLGDFWRKINSDISLSNTYPLILKRVGATNVWSENGTGSGDLICNRIAIKFEVIKKQRIITIQLVKIGNGVGITNNMFTLMSSYKFIGCDYIDFKKDLIDITTQNTEDWYYTSSVLTYLNTTTIFNGIYKSDWIDFFSRLKPLCPSFFKEFKEFVSPNQDVELDISTYPNEIQFTIPTDNYFYNTRGYLIKPQDYIVTLKKTDADLNDTDIPYAWMENSTYGWTPIQSNRFILIPSVKYGFEVLYLYVLTYNNYDQPMTYVNVLTVYAPNRWSRKNTFLGNLYNTNTLYNLVISNNEALVRTSINGQYIYYKEPILKVKGGTPVYPSTIFTEGVDSFPEGIFGEIIKQPNIELVTNKFNIQILSINTSIVSYSPERIIYTTYENTEKKCYYTVRTSYKSELFVKYNLEIYDEVYAWCWCSDTNSTERACTYYNTCRESIRNAWWSAIPNYCGSTRYCMTVSNHTERSCYYLPSSLGTVISYRIEFGILTKKYTDRTCLCHPHTLEDGYTLDTNRYCGYRILTASNRYARCAIYVKTGLSSFPLILSTIYNSERFGCINTTGIYPSIRLASVALQVSNDRNCKFILYEKASLNDIPLILRVNGYSERYALPSVIGAYTELTATFDTSYKVERYCTLQTSLGYINERYASYTIYEKGTLFSITIVPARIYPNERYCYYSAILNYTERKCYNTCRDIRLVERMDNYDFDFLLMSKNDANKNIKLTTYGNIDTLIGDLTDEYSIVYSEENDKNDINILTNITDAYTSKEFTMFTNFGAPIQKTNDEIILKNIGTSKFNLNAVYVYELNVVNGIIKIQNTEPFVDNHNVDVYTNNILVSYDDVLINYNTTLEPDINIKTISYDNITVDYYTLIIKHYSIGNEDAGVLITRNFN